MLSPVKVAPHQAASAAGDPSTATEQPSEVAQSTADPKPSDIEGGGETAEGPGDQSEEDSDDSGDEVAEITEVQRKAAYTRLSSSHLIQMRGPRANTVGFRDMISKEKPPEIVQPARLAAIAAAPKTMNSKIRSFDVIKAVYVFLLLPIHLTNLTAWVRDNDAYASSYLPYKTTDHGQEYIMGVMLLSGWLSNATLKSDLSLGDFFQKKLIRLMPSYFLGAIPLSLICIIIRISVDSHSPTRIVQLFAQFLLEVVTLGPWNPAMIWWTSNLPLWFMNTLLAYYYVSWHFIRWLRAVESVRFLIALLVALVVVRAVTASAVLVALMYVYPDTYATYGFLIHTWTVVQLSLPFMGAILAEIAARVGPMKLTKIQIWALTDAWSLCAVSLAFFIGPFSSNDRVSYFFANMCDYGDLLVAPFLIIGLYLHSHDFSTLSFLYSRFPRFWADLVRMSFPAFLFHWPIMICLIIFSRDSLRFDKPMDVVFISGMAVLLSVFVDSYVVLAFEDDFLAVVKPRLSAFLERFEATKSVKKAAVEPPKEPAKAV